MAIPKKKVKWFPDELKFIKENYRKLSYAQMIDHINSLRTEKNKIHIGALRHQRARMKCFISKQKNNRLLKREDLFLRRCYTFIGDVELAHHLTAMSNGRRKFTRKKVISARMKRKLNRKQYQVDRILQDNIMVGCYNTGAQAWAKRVSKDATIKTWIIGGRKVKHIKIDGTFIPFTRWFYQNFLGEIPNGKLVFHLDGDALNNHPDNLELLTRKEAIKKQLLRKPKPKIIETESRNEFVTVHDYFNL